MSAPASTPRLSQALVISWLLLTVDGVAYTLWSQHAIEAAIESPADALDQTFETFVMISRVHWLLLMGLWTTLAVGLWTTAQSRDAAPLHQAALLLVGQIVVDVVTMAVVRLVPESDSVLLDLAPLVGVLLMLGAGALVLLHAHRCGAALAHLALPIFAELAMLVLVFNGFLVSQEIDLLELSSEALRYLYPALALVFWLSWLTVPRAVLSLDPQPSADDPAALDPAAADGSRQRDIVVGLAWAGGGLLVTVVTMTGGGIDGRGLLAWGPIIYGCFLIFRGLSRDR